MFGYGTWPGTWSTLCWIITGWKNPSRSSATPRVLLSASVPLRTEPYRSARPVRHFDSVPSLSGDSDGRLACGPRCVRLRTHRCSKLANGFVCGGHAHCYAILISMISEHVQFLCRCLLQCRLGPRLSLNHRTPSYPLSARLPPFGCRWTCRRYSTCCFHSQVCLDPRADDRSCRHGLDEAQLAVALRETTIFVSSVFTHMDL